MKNLFVCTAGLALLVIIATDLSAGEMSKRDEIVQLEAILKDSSDASPTDSTSPRRRDAIYYLGKIDDRRAFDLIRHTLLNDPYPAVRSMAAEVLQMSSFESEAKLVLDSALRDSSFPVRLYAAASLCRLGSKNPQVFNILKNAAIGEGQKIWNTKGFLMPDAGEHLVQSVREGWQQHAIRSLGYSGSDIAAETLTRVSKSVPEEDEYQVQKAIKKNNERRR